tara:strand:+ start:2687 stop:3271 length:585 start_codon:yes stop_codon:yes gene_type:complete
MKFHEVAPYFIIAILLIYIVNLKKDDNVLISEKFATKVITSPEPVVLRDTVFLDNNVIILKERRPVVDSVLLDKYNSLKDSISKTQVFKDAITQRTYKEELKDSVQTITVTSKVTGTLTEQIISYRTNPITIERKSLRSDTGVYLGGFTSLPAQTITDNFAVGINMHVQRSKVMYSLGYDTQKRIQLGVAFKIL